MKNILFLFYILPLSLAAQLITGTVQDNENEPLVGASVTIVGTTTGTTTDIHGQFELNASPEDSLQISFVGFQTKVLAVANRQKLDIQLQPDTELEAVTVESSATFIDELQPIHSEVITEKELLKAACCNLSESFETNASVDVSFTDAVTGTKMIRMLGLDGKYTLINRENMPLVRGLTSRAGLNLVPGTWIQSIDVGKGAGSVVNGFESMTGQINLEYKKPETAEKLYLNAYANSFGRTELNANATVQLNDKWSTGILAHTDYFAADRDKNNDGFMDLPKARQINVLNRYKYMGDRVRSQIGLHVLKDQKAGGQLGFDFGDDTSTSDLYGYSSETTRAELFGKFGLLFPEAPYKGWGLLYSLSYQKQTSGFGRRSYIGEEKTLYTNLIHQNILGNSFHQYKLGGSLLVDLYDEQFADSLFARNEIVPGGFFEYTYLPNDQFTLVLGSRLDFHNLYGIYHSPRIHTKYAFGKGTTLRAAAGKGYRTSNIIPENNQTLVSSRRLVVEESLQPEESWNLGGSLVQEVTIGSKRLNLTADYFYTIFENQVITDMDQNPQEVRFYNLDGKSYASSLQLEADYKVTPRLSTKAAYKLYDVKATINDQLQPLPFVAKNRFFWNWSYSSKYDIWQADLTLQWYGKKRLPDTSEKPEAFQQQDYAPDFTNINAQVSRAFRWGNVYIGSENLLDFRQDNPIIDPENPFGENFDGSLVWGPVAGRVIYFGVRYKID
ncbi:TonB-dependent receptor plug domain-containing protein [Marinoscillum furvescens]|uniref:Outer membrane receptor for ferrienterochelin and colicin n=1 Tax=Marinoscillum furvescens DSM 4134 TaxID=1122208 RepID=A0A3D9LIQ2_MARFU|nr:carboxypeptidase-like regulatory domain-containing protein [Marinoscillum furvescens]REE05546.1 outer membrane receptor for ferrienterochelin and colicin [Marinoscillum furvescens DSM 4134]